MRLAGLPQSWGPAGPSHGVGAPPPLPRRELRAALRTVPTPEPRLPAPDHRSTLAGVCPARAHRTRPSLCPQDRRVLGDRLAR